MRLQPDKPGGRTCALPFPQPPTHLSIHLGMTGAPLTYTSQQFCLCKRSPCEATEATNADVLAWIGGALSRTGLPSIVEAVRIVHVDHCVLGHLCRNSLEVWGAGGGCLVAELDPWPASEVIHGEAMWSQVRWARG